MTAPVDRDRATRDRLWLVTMAHRPISPSAAEIQCACGWVGSSHTGHVADMLAAPGGVVAELVGEGQAEAAAALRIIDRHGCEHFTVGRCLDPGSGKVRGAQYAADAWCYPCVAAAALRAPRTGGAT